MSLPADDELYAILGVKPGADAQAVRAAYLARVREHPPERDPEWFERIRDAYQTLSSPKRKMRRYFEFDDLMRKPMRDLLLDPDCREGRPFLGVGPWLELLRHEGRS